MKRLIVIVSTFVFAILLTGLSTAQEVEKDSATKNEKEKKEKKVHVIKEITVIATQPGVEITTEKTVIDMDKFKKPGSVRTVTDVLTEIGGVDVHRLNPLLSSPGDEVAIRGLSEGRMVIEIDGRRINHTGHYGRYIVDWSTLNIDDIERIEIIRGGHSVLHPFAIGGVINIITKRGKKTEELKPEVKVNAGYGAFNTYNAGATVNGGLLDFIGYNFSGSKQGTDGYLRNNFQENTSYSGQLTFFLPKDATLSFSAKFSEVRYGFPVLNDISRSDYDSDYPTFLGTADQLRHIPPVGQIAENDPHWTRHTRYLDAILNVPIGPGEFKIHGFQTYGKRWTHMWSQGAFTKTLSEDETLGIIGEYRNIKLLDFNRVTIGAEYQQLGEPTNTEESKIHEIKRTSNSKTYEVKSAYIQDIISIGKRVKVTPGVRYYHVDMKTYYAWFEEGKTAPDWPTEGKTGEDYGWFPSIKVDIQAAQDTALYAAASRSYRLPCP